MTPDPVLPFTPPEFIDNREIRMADAVRGYLEHLQRTLREPPRVDFASGYFNPEGFALLIPALRGCRRIRLLLGAEPTPALLRTPRSPGAPRKEKWEQQLVQRAITETEQGMLSERDRIPFVPEADGAVRDLLAFLREAPIEVRRYEAGFLHGKAVLFGDRQGLFSGSSNLTLAGLTRNLELNVGSFQPSLVGKAATWYEELWQAAKPYDLAALYADRFAEYDPYLVYLRVLWERYGDELEIEAEEGGRIRLTTFQRDGLDRALRILARYDGVLIADGVGLGKTFLAGEMLRRAVEDDNRRALLISPASLRDGTWERFLLAHQLGIENISYEQLANEKQLGGDRATLARPLREYDLVIVDEAQAFRNPDTVRGRALRRLLEGKPRKKLILLTATPVNNSLWDLFTLFRYFLGHDGVFARIGIPSLREKFSRAAAIDPYDLSPDALFDVIDEVTVRRTRQFVKRFYPNESIRLRDGSEVRIRFPQPRVSAVGYKLERHLPGFLDELEAALAPADGQPRLTMARYLPSMYEIPPQESVSEMALVGLVRSGLLKRFESSVHAFRETLRRMAESHEKFLKALDHGWIARLRDLDEWSPGDSDEELDRILTEGDSERSDGYDVESLKRDVQADLQVLRELHAHVKDVDPEDDPKLGQLEEELVDIARRAEHDGYGPDDFRDKRKVILFSYFEDTLDWIRGFLKKRLRENPELRVYRGRLASVSGTEGHDGVNRRDAVFGFAPVSSEAPPETEDRYDILLTTDVLAEGMNLQQCRNLVNYDLPWNPMRLVQRHGRIDRIGSPHEEVFIRCFFPDERLDEMLALEVRIRRKLAQAAATIGIESEVVPGGAVQEQVFEDTRRKIEGIHRGEDRLFITEGGDPTAQSGEEYRQELRKGLQTRGDQIRNLPGCAGSGFSGGQVGGVFFCARVGDRVFLRFVGGDRLERETLTCLKRIHCHQDTPRELDRADREGAYQAWVRARRDIREEWMRLTDPVNLLPKVERTFREMASHVRQHPADLGQEERDRLIATLEAPWDVRTRRAFQDLLHSDRDDPDGLTTRIRDLVRERGMRPLEPLAPLPPIDEDEIALVCWMVVKAT